MVYKKKQKKKHYIHLEPCTGKTQVVYFTYEPPGRFISKIRNLWFLNLLYLYFVLVKFM